MKACVQASQLLAPLLSAWASPIEAPESHPRCCLSRSSGSDKRSRAVPACSCCLPEPQPISLVSLRIGIPNLIPGADPCFCFLIGEYLEGEHLVPVNVVLQHLLTLDSEQADRSDSNTYTVLEIQESDAQMNVSLVCHRSPFPGLGILP